MRLVTAQVRPDGEDSVHGVHQGVGRHWDRSAPQRSQPPDGLLPTADFSDLTALLTDITTVGEAQSVGSHDDN